MRQNRYGPTGAPVGEAPQFIDAKKFFKISFLDICGFVFFPILPFKNISIYFPRV